MNVLPRLVVLSSVMLLTALDLRAVQPQADAGARVVQAFDALETQLLETPDVSKPLASGRDELVLLIQKYPRAARSWQLSPSLAREMKPEEIFALVTTRANSLLACGTAAMAQWDLRKDAAPAAAQAEIPPMAPRMWKGAPDSPLRITPDCAKVVNADGQPVTLSTRADLDAVRALMARFDQVTAAREVSQAKRAPLFGANLEYLRKEYGGAPEREPKIEALVGSPTKPVFSRQVLMFRAFILSTGTEDKLILLVPLSV